MAPLNNDKKNTKGLYNVDIIIHKKVLNVKYCESIGLRE